MGEIFGFKSANCESSLKFCLFAAAESKTLTFFVKFHDFFENLVKISRFDLVISFKKNYTLAKLENLSTTKPRSDCLGLNSASCFLFVGRMPPAWHTQSVGLFERVCLKLFWDFPRLSEVFRRIFEF